MKDNGQFKIEKGIPIPDSRHVAGFSAMLRKLKPGDSILRTGIICGGQVTGNIGKVSKQTGFKFTTRKVEGGVRVWRVS